MIWCVLYRAVVQAFFERGTGQTRQEPEIHIHTLNDWCLQLYSTKNHLVWLALLSKKSKEHHNSHRKREFERDVRMCVFMWTWKDKPYWQHGRCSPQGTERDGDRSLTAVWWREMRPGTVPEGTHHIQINDFIQPHT